MSLPSHARHFDKQLSSDARLCFLLISQRKFACVNLIRDMPVIHGQTMLQEEPLTVFVCGAHSTGKSTLLEDLSTNETFLLYEKEVARKIIRDLKWKREDFLPSHNPANFEKLQVEIIRAQHTIDRRNTADGKSYMSDRTIDPIIYAKMYLDEEAAQRILQLAETRELIQR